MTFFAIVDTLNKILEVNNHPKKSALTINIYEIKTMKMFCVQKSFSPQVVYIGSLSHN